MPDLLDKSALMQEILKRYWGYDTFRPFQEEAIHAILNRKDSLVVLPTGGGKSLCFQIPALMQKGLTVIVSPLISLMKDQVDSLKEMGIEAAFLNSSLTQKEFYAVLQQIHSEKIKLLYVAPERLLDERTVSLLQKMELSFFVIDEAHCISHWGHDFREAYRHLGRLKELFPNKNLHAFTATATGEVQKDIVQQLQLKNPEVRIAPIDRENLTYRIFLRSSGLTQIIRLLEKHKNESGIIYCIRRDDVNTLSTQLNELGYKNLPYHAGLSDEVRKNHQDQFAHEEVDLIVATVAFGMGIDRSNIRFVIHAAMPKNIEYYHQETGRAGRDGLPAYCYLFYGGIDYRTWQMILSDSSQSDVLMDKLNTFYHFCSQPQCRHKGFSQYFGQRYLKENCDSCDYCLGELEMVENPLVETQKILSCVWRVRQKFGADHISNILIGQKKENLIHWQHDKLSTFGIMQNYSKSHIRSLIEQLIGQNFLERDPEFATLSITELGMQALKGKTVPILAKPLLAVKKKQIEKKNKIRREQEWENVDGKLFQKLREKRAELARKKGVPAFIIFGDKTLKDMALNQPESREEFTKIYGVGERKRVQYAEIFLTVIKNYKNDLQKQK